MNPAPYISKLFIYPIKALGHVEVSEAQVGEGALVNDRAFAMVDSNGKYINGKRTKQVNLLGTSYDLERGIVQFQDKRDNGLAEFELREGNKDLDEYLSDFFSVQLNLLHNDQGQFMDIPKDAAITVVSEASLRSLQADLGKHSLDNLRQRFRTTIEIAGVEAYWEENLYGKPDVDVRFRMGEVDMIGISPRARCSVPPQNPIDGEIDRSFMKTMIESRAMNLISESKLHEYGQVPYYLSVNVAVPTTEIGKKIGLDDKIEILY